MSSTKDIVFIIINLQDGTEYGKEEYALLYEYGQGEGDKGVIAADNSRYKYGASNKENYVKKKTVVV